MRTVHEPEPPRTTGTNNASTNDPAPSGKKSGIKIKLTNGNAAGTAPKPTPPTPTEQAALLAPSHDEDGNPVTPSNPHDNIQYIPAHHPITGQPGFMITYPPDIHFSAWESSIAADQLLRLLRRQVDWAEKEGEALKVEVEKLERVKREEFMLKEMLLDGALEEDYERAKREGWLDDVPGIPKRMMEADAEPGKAHRWTHGTPSWRRDGQGAQAGHAMQNASVTRMWRCPMRQQHRQRNLLHRGLRLRRQPGIVVVGLMAMRILMIITLLLGWRSTMNVSAYAVCRTRHRSSGRRRRRLTLLAR